MFKKVVSSVVIAFFLLGGVVIAQPGKAHAASRASAVGVVDFGLLINQHPDTQKGNEALQAEVEQAKKEFETKSANMSDKEKQELEQQLGQHLESKRRELLGAVIDKINAAVKDIADAKGLTIVVDKNAVVYGGQDITVEVGKKLNRE